MGESPTRISCAVDPRDLIAATQWAVKRVARDSTDAILGGMRVELDEHDVTLTGFDRDVSHTATIARQDLGVTSGVAVVSGRKLAELAKTFPGKPVQIEEGSSMLYLACGSVKVALPLMTAEDYPAWPHVADGLGMISAAALRDAVGRVLAAADQKNDTAKAAHTGVLVSFGAESTSLIATNGYRVAIAEAPALEWNPIAEGVPPTEPIKVLIPWAVLGDLVHAIEGDPPILIGYNGYNLSLASEHRTAVTSLLIADHFPRFRMQNAKRAEKPTTVAVAELREAMKRARLALDKDDPIVLSFEADRVAVEGAGSVSATNVRTDVACEHHDDPCRFKVNPTYLDDALEACGTTNAELTLSSDPKRPILVTAPDVAGFAHVIMPIRKL